MSLPKESILYLFNGELSKEQLVELDWYINDLGGFKNEEVYWLNTPGPIYTTQTDNCGTGQPEAPNNVGGDENYYEFIFKQPFNEKELLEVKSSAEVDPLSGYYIDGNKYWTKEKIIEWWEKIESVIDYMVNRYEKELQLPSNPHNRLYDFGKGLEEAHFYGPIEPLPKNYKAALDFYQYEIKNYLEWYMKLNNGKTIELRKVEYNWSKKIKLDNMHKTFNPKRLDLFEEYKKSKECSNNYTQNKSFLNKMKSLIKRKN
jgi:hypothetical protein